MTDSTANIANLTMEIDIDASPADVWAALTADIGDWWPADFYAGGEAGKRRFTLDTTPGGLMAEHWEGGGGTVWGSVIAVNPGSLLQVLGNVFPNWGGPTQWYGTWQLAAKGKGTTLTFSEAGVGKVSASSTDEKDKGWRFLWATLKAHVEGGAPPEWTD